jgi:hypothetical protein
MRALHWYRHWYSLKTRQQATTYGEGTGIRRRIDNPTQKHAVHKERSDAKEKATATTSMAPISFRSEHVTKQSRNKSRRIQHGRSTAMGVPATG